jgi:hypothetical protein
MSTRDSDQFAYPPIRPRVSVEELLATKNTQPIRSLADLAADTFGSDEELQESLVFTYAERQRDIAGSRQSHFSDPDRTDHKSQPATQQRVRVDRYDDEEIGVKRNPEPRGELPTRMPA